MELTIPGVTEKTKMLTTRSFYSSLQKGDAVILLVHSGFWNLSGLRAKDSQHWDQTAISDLQRRNSKQIENVIICEIFWHKKT